MTENIKALADLVEQYPSRVRIDYDDNDDRRFCNNVLLALKKAWPELLPLCADLLAEYVPLKQALVVPGTLNKNLGLPTGEA